MMKKYLLLSVACLSVVSTGIHAGRERNKKVTLDEAIENVNLKLVQKLLKREGIAEETRKKLLLETAEDIVEECEERVSLVKSGWDCARFGWWSTWTGLGVAACAFGTAVALTPKGREDNSDYLETKKLALGGAGIGALWTLLGGYFLSNAWKCPTALRRVEIARKIEDLIRNAPVSSENSDLK
ncbi:hypothetical protein H0X06_01330 [Candidatus Dependentiae bacterium]|nr:hypothetical protein [Candidatus Dependentiae bacterium]